MLVGSAELVARAQTDLEARKTTGKILLEP
jgi:hypothetical protein